MKNRIGFVVLGLTNNFAYVIMLSAAYDLLKSTSSNTTTTTSTNANSNVTSLTTITNQQVSTPPFLNSISQNNNTEQKYCNEHSTSTILLADTLPSLTTKIIYPFLLVGLPNAYKASATAFLSAIAFIITGLSKSQVMIFTGVVCASFSSGLGESTYLSSTPLYGDVSLYGWSMGTGAAGLLGAISYALLTLILPVEPIMMIMLVVPVAMMFAYFQVIEPISDNSTDTDNTAQFRVRRQQAADENNEPGLSTISRGVDEQERSIEGISLIRSYGTTEPTAGNQTVSFSQDKTTDDTPFDFQAKLRCLPSLAKYFLPLLLVYFAEYFINQGLFELVYYPEVSFLNHAAQYRWFQVSYQLGVMISRSSLDFIQIKNLWLMSILQAINAALFLLHASKLLHIPSFYIVIALIIYEGLLGGFTYVNTFYRVKKEVRANRQEFCISTVTTADSLGIVMAAVVALPVHDALCKLYE